MKDIKDYLHLYIEIDCQFKERKSGRMFTRPLEPSDIDHYFQEDYYLYIKPILRPLDDMSRDEKEYLWNMSNGIMLPPGIETECRIEAAKTLYLSQKGFDLFGLIDLDLAIDKTML